MQYPTNRVVHVGCPTEVKKDVNENPRVILSFCLLFRNCLTAPQFSHFVRCLTQRIIYTPRHVSHSFLHQIFTRVPALSNIGRFFSSEFTNWIQFHSVRLNLIAKHYRSRQGSLLLDDVTCRKHGKKFEDLGMHWSGADKKVVPGHNFVTSVLKNSKGWIAYDWREYFQKKVVSNDPFKTKLTLALEMVDDALKRKLINRVPGDSWYGVKTFLKALNKRSLQFVFDHRIDKTLIKIEDVKQSIKGFVDALSDHQYVNRRLKKGKRTQKIRYCSTIAYYYGVGKVKLVVCQYWNSRKKKWKNERVLITNVLYWSALKVIREYAQRWSIEVFHREAKQSYGLSDYQVLKRRARHTHVGLAFVASVYRTLTSFRLVGKSKAVTSAESGADAPLKRIAPEDTIWQVLAAKNKGTLRELLEVNNMDIQHFKAFL